MALTRRTVAATLAALALAGAAAQPAQAYWHASGSRTGTVPTAVGVTKVLTLSLATNKNGKVTVSGNAGTGAGYASTVSAVLCAVNTWPCPAPSTLASQPSLSTSGGTYGFTSGVLTAGTVYGAATQSETSGWTDKAFAGPVTP
jgi:hypothetical protein